MQRQSSAFVPPVPLTTALAPPCGRCRCNRYPPVASPSRLVSCSTSQSSSASSSPSPSSTSTSSTPSVSRRAVLSVLCLAPISLALPAESRVVVADPDAGSVVTTTSSGLQYYDFVSSSSSTSPTSSPTTNTSRPVQAGDDVTIQYTMGTTGARNGWRIDSDTLTFRVGSGAVIAGLDEGVVGMRPSDRRRLLVPPALGYRAPGDAPVPKGFAEFQRFKNVYLNINRPFIPDVVFDVTLLKLRPR